MKTQSITIFSKVKTLSNEAVLLRKDAQLKDMAQKDGKHLALIGRPHPINDRLVHYIHPYKSGYEELIAQTLEYYMPASQYPEGRIELDWSKDKKKKLVAEIAKLSEEISFLLRDIDGYNPEEMAKRILRTRLLSAGVFGGEVVFNMQSFEYTGENKISALIISGFIAFVIAIAAHATGCMYKDAEDNVWKKRKILIGALMFSASFAIVLASLRNKMLLKYDIHVNPWLFIVANLGIFAVGAWLTWRYYPSQKEQEANKIALNKYKKMQELIEQKEKKEQELLQHEEEAKEKMQEYIRRTMQASYAIERIKKMYKETVSKFISTNMQYRKEVPAFANDPIPDLDIPDVTFLSTLNKFNDHENN